MPLPSFEQYSRIIERKDPSTLSTLFDHEFSFRENGYGKELYFNLGTSAVVFKAVKDGKTYAVRCFLRGDLETFRRYEQLAAFLESRNPSWRVNFEFLDNEILIDGHYYPVVKMDWEGGMPLHQYIDKYLADEISISLLQQKLVELSSGLEKQGVGHGDLKYNNILVRHSSTGIDLKLIDYDSMFIPAFQGGKNMETGSPGFQPLKRLSSHFFESIDRFSIWVMLTTLEAVKTDQAIWQNIEQGGFNNEHSLFTASDFYNPNNSRTIQKLKGYKNADLDYYLDKIIRFSQYSDLKAIERPGVFKDASGIPFTHQKWVVPPSPVPESLPESDELWKRFEIEIKSIPSGKDVMVYGIKKGITPLRLSLLKKDFEHVEVINGSQKTRVPILEGKRIYEIDFIVKEIQPPNPIVEQDEILEFNADRYTIQEGELATINWKVKGNSRIHISNMGDIFEKTGTKKVVLRNTTDYVLTIGSKNRSLTINVQPEARQKASFIPPTVTEIENVDDSDATIKPDQRKTIPWKAGALIFAFVLATSFLLFNYFSNSKNIPQVASSTNAGVKPTLPHAAKPILFTKAKVTNMLEKLYAAYNQRDLPSIMSFYAPTVNEYYSSALLSKDSLQTLINDLFITPASYKCTPNFSSMTIQPGEQTCTVTITINEKLKKNRRSRTENYNTTINYTLSPTLQIVAEKNVD